MATGEAYREWYQAHRAEQLERVKQWRAEHADEIAAQRRAFYAANRDRLRDEQRRQYRPRNAGELARQRERDRLARADPEQRALRLERTRRWREANPDVVQASSASVNANRRPESKARGERITTKDVLALWTRQPVCVTCGIGRGVDHIVRLKDGGSNAPGNLQNLCQTCNARKEQAGRALPPDHPNYERARRFRESRHRATIGPAAR